GNRLRLLPAVELREWETLDRLLDGNAAQGHGRQPGQQEEGRPGSGPGEHVPRRAGQPGPTLRGAGQAAAEGGYEDGLRPRVRRGGEDVRAPGAALQRPERTGLLPHSGAAG